MLKKDTFKYTGDDVSWQDVTGFVMTWREKPSVPGDVTPRVVHLTEFFWRCIYTGLAVLESR